MYHNRAIAAQEIIEELIKLAQDLAAAGKRGEELGLNEEEVAFYDARAKIRVLVKRILNRHGYPPDLQDAHRRVRCARLRQMKPCKPSSAQPNSSARTGSKPSGASPSPTEPAPGAPAPPNTLPSFSADSSGSDGATPPPPALLPPPVQADGARIHQDVGP